MKKITIILLIILLLALGLFYYFLSQKPKNKLTPINNNQVEQVPAEAGIKATFLCRDNKNIQAEFFNGTNNHVKLILSDGRGLDLPHALSADGARYANPDESIVFWNKGETAFVTESYNMTYQDCIDSQSATLANPASVNCRKQGGQLVIASKPDGSQYGLCYFDDNRACEEWAMLRGDCPVGGRKTTGYDTEAQKFCAWSGGDTLAVAQAVCTFADGSTCLADDFYAGTCQKGEKK